MTDHLPRPLLAAVGALTQVRRVPGLLLTSPLLALSAYDRARRTYDQLALRGQQVVADRFGDTESGPGGPVLLPDGQDAEVLDAVSHVADPLDTAPHPARRRATRQEPRPPVTRDADEPLPDFDEMTLGALRGSLRELSVEQLRTLLEYERAHQARPPVLHLVEHRLATLTLP